jgi:hypothetical protein
MCTGPLYTGHFFQVLVKNGSMVQSSCNKKAAARAAFIRCEPDWTEFESFSKRFENFGEFSSLKM